LEDFKEFVKKMNSIHRSCGKDCVHLMRFYLRLGYISQKYYNRKKTIRLAKTTVKPFKESGKLN
jgi:hypothetical protein